MAFACSKFSYKNNPSLIYFWIRFSRRRRLLFLYGSFLCLTAVCFRLMNVHLKINIYFLNNTRIEIYKIFYVEIHSPDFPPSAFCESILSMKSVNMICKRAQQSILKIDSMSVHTRIYSTSI